MPLALTSANALWSIPMNGRERLLAAFSGEELDRVPFAPDIDLVAMNWWSRETGRPWWRAYLHNDPSVREIYIDANKRLGCDVWDYWHGLAIERPIKSKTEVIGETDSGIHLRKTTETPHGALTERHFYPRDAPPWCVERRIKSIEEDWPKVKWLMEQEAFSARIEPEPCVGDAGITEIGPSLFPDFWVPLRGAEQALVDFIRSSDAIGEIFEYYSEYVASHTECCVRTDADAILIQGSASSTSLISPSTYRRYSLPLVKKITRLCSEAGIPSHQHTCGRSRHIIQMNYEETDLDVMEPLEGPPTGDVDLAEVKDRFGGRLCLKGNINTVVLLQEGSSGVERAVRKAIEDAAPGGGFVLSTGDSPGANTPDANVMEMARSTRAYGRYRGGK